LLQAAVPPGGAAETDKPQEITDSWLSRHPLPAQGRPP